MNRIDEIRARMLPLEYNGDNNPDTMQADIGYLLGLIEQIQQRAGPLRYAVSHLQHGTEKDAIISADVGYMYADDDDRYLRLTDLTALIFGIYYGDNEPPAQPPENGERDADIH